MSAPALDCITAARTGRPLGEAAITGLIADYLDGSVPDYQLAAWLMAVACNGLAVEDTVTLTRVLAATGQQLNLRDLAPFVADKHSTGGIGDNTTLVLVPLLAAVGIPVGKLTGRSLGHHGGTVDKLESISGLHLPADAAEFTKSLAATGIGLTGQSDHLAPGDGALYALRDVTGTVDSIPLIASSIMSKKLAAGTSACVLDVKTGPGAVLTDPTATLELARLMVDIGNRAGLPTRAVISDMSQPLGHAIGNTLEVAEAVHALSGRHVPGLTDLTLALAQLIAAQAWPDHTADRIRHRLHTALADGSALAALRRWVEHLGGDVRQIDDPALLPAADVRLAVPAPASGVVHRIDGDELGRIAAELGAGRARADSPIDPAVGIQLHRRVGDPVRADEPVAELHLRTTHDQAALLQRTAAAFTVADGPATAPPLIHHTI
ncbi:thymidine phosphorylase [Kitasatospora indigofera]|uniref:Thymidine phosphorylase n=1 Tax=Kitasatospora indigofera TaxID=67307 RepID=A0A919GAR0_9ACTN|nr:thymidine phosphorylase [Kitasatospora indigofera]GHH80475.1 thymidine phosphorylase [Kitasatospora indigofera]